ncbi:pre-60S factor rei1 [Coemansia thaxteri]|uniref:Pre-60S factor rei1 n=1 Tax=Coemansia thaxteri TaxID=2663907 RepID=A0A9W8EEY4_9FUNG|nr:pre-60S factor rei1 [Coemansia thaxteri]
MDDSTAATASTAQTPTGSVPTNAQNTPLFTCMACQVAFYSADQQRTHYRSDWHRYNLKRKVADLPAVSAESFAQRVLAQQAKAVEISKRAEFSAECKVCKKNYGTENAFNNHLNSKKHKEAEAQVLRRMQEEEDVRAEQEAIAESIAATVVVLAAGQEDGNATSAALGSVGTGSQRVLKASNFPMSDDEDGESGDEEEGSSEVEASMDVDAVASGSADAELARRRLEEREIKKQLHQATTEEEVVKLLEKRKAAAPRLNPDTDCIFCPHQSESFESNMGHMSVAHSLFIPDLEYIVDLRGLIKYLADKVSVANVCLYCNGRGRALQSLEAVRRHMLDKGHTKIAYETEIDILEISDFYDFSSTYPDAADHDGDNMLLDSDEQLAKTGGRLGVPGARMQVLEEEDGELVLPSGSRIGHRSLQRYYRQTIPSEQPEKESVVIHKMLTNYAENPEYCNQLVQCSRNRAVILAQNNGQRAWKDIATFKENRARENFQTRVGVKANRLQRYFREQLI